MKKVLKILLILLAVVLAAAVIYVAYVMLSYNRIPDGQELTPRNPQEAAAAAQTDAVRRGLYTTATLVPAIGFFVVAAILWFVYPLDKRRVEKNVEELKKKHLPAEH